jgi:predicted N-acetyltransferase YhbS
MSGLATEPATTIRPLAEADLDDADRIFRLAFGTFLGLPDPLQFFEGASYVRGRWLTDPAAAFGAESDGELVASNFATNWGSVGFFGPLTVRPDQQGRGIGKQLMEPIMECFESWRATHAGLFTFAHSEKHVGLYQRFGFYPRFLTAIMGKPVSAGGDVRATPYSEFTQAERDSALAACGEVTDAIYDGLDVTREIESVAERGIGETLLLDDGGSVAAFAVLHAGEGSEAGRGTGYVKFAAVRPGPGATELLDELLEECERVTAERGLERLDVGTNLAREETYRVLLARGYRTWLQGVAMHKPNEPGYSRPGVVLIDDWR